MNISKNNFQEESILESHAVLENAKVSTYGIVSYIEWDILEVKLEQSELYYLGESVKIIIYTGQGTLYFESNVIAKTEVSVTILIPDQIQKKMNKRKFPRVIVEIEATLENAKQVSEESDKLEDISLTITNISMGGIGFTLDHEHKFHLKKELNIHFILEESEISCLVEIVHRSINDTEYTYGAKFLNLPDALLSKIRSYILRQQIFERAESLPIQIETFLKKN